jgi:hypothetical protein
MPTGVPAPHPATWDFPAESHRRRSGNAGAKPYYATSARRHEMTLTWIIVIVCVGYVLYRYG